MTEFEDVEEELQALKFAKKTVKNDKPDLFDQFQNSRQIIKNNRTQNSSKVDIYGNGSNNKISFQDSKNKSKQKQQNQDEYGQDFEQDEYLQKFNNKTAKKKEKEDNKTKNYNMNNSSLNNSGVNQKKAQKSRQKSITKEDESRLNHKNKNKHVEVQNSIKDKNKSRNNSKSVMERNQTGSDNTAQMGRYEAQVQRKFGNINGESANNQSIHRYNEQIRQQIKKFNDILTNLINKNLTQLTIANKNKKPNSSSPNSVQQSIKIIREELKNNSKVQQMDLAELKKLQNYNTKLEEQENYSDKTLQQQIIQIKNQIKQKKKLIHNKKLQIQNQSKKLLPANANHQIMSSKNQVSSQIGSLKQKLNMAKKQHEKNTQKLSNLESRQYQITTKIEDLGADTGVDIDKQVNQIRSNEKGTEDRKKRYQQIKKKHQDIKSFITKTEGLWSSKYNLGLNENYSIRQKIKNIDLQIKNIEQSIKLSYQKSMRTIETTKPKNDQSLKMLDKIKGQMNQYRQNQSNNKQMSLSQMKIFNKKKPSQQNITNNQQTNAVQEGTRTQKQSRTQQSQRNRVWKQQSKQQSNKQQAASREQKRQQIKKQDSEEKPKLNQEEKKNQQANNNPAISSQGGPKKFNFNRNKSNSEAKLQPNKPDQNQNSKTNPLQLNIKSKIDSQPIIQVPSEQTNKGEKQKATDRVNEQNQEPVIKPKRFLGQRKVRQQNQGYVPTGQNKAKQQVSGDTTNNNRNSGLNINENKNQPSNSQTNKPTFNLKRNRNNQNKTKLELDNQFMNH